MLTEAQLIERQNGIGGSDAKKIVSGAWHELWLDKTGRQTPKAILTPWDVSVRHALEPLVMDDYAEQNNRPVTRRGDLVISDKDSTLYIRWVRRRNGAGGCQGSEHMDA